MRLTNLQLSGLFVSIIIVCVIALTLTKAIAEPKKSSPRGESLGAIYHGRLYRFETPSATCFIYDNDGDESLSCIPSSSQITKTDR
jgi:hypothetical protein